MSIALYAREIAAVAAAAIALAGAPVAMADDPKSSTMTVDQAATVVHSGKLGNRKICVRDTLTGSRVPRQICDTLDGWKARGIDPLADAK